jgi:predicted RNase H-like HicB family nuclease
MSSVEKPRPTEDSVEHYANLPYHLTIVHDTEEKARPWTASVEELPGCTTRGRTSDEVLASVRSAMTHWIEAALQEGREIPEPKSANSHSGRLLLRMPRTLHAELTRVAEREGVSLNQFITDALASAVAWRGGKNSSPETGTAAISQEPGVDSLTADPLTPHRSRRNAGNRNLVTAVLAANFVIVAIAGIVAIIVLIAAWL